MHDERQRSADRLVDTSHGRAHVGDKAGEVRGGLVCNRTRSRRSPRSRCAVACTPATSRASASFRRRMPSVTEASSATAGVLTALSVRPRPRVSTLDGADARVVVAVGRPAT